MGREIVSWEGGDRLGWWGLERSSSNYSVEFLWMLKIKDFFGWYDAGRAGLLSAGGSNSHLACSPSMRNVYLGPFLADLLRIVA
jgi:hypothetical protein